MAELVGLLLWPLRKLCAWLDRAEEEALDAYNMAMKSNDELDSALSRAERRHR